MSINLTMVMEVLIFAVFIAIIYFGYRVKPKLGEPKREFVPLLILCVATGFLGMHRFYSGKTITGMLMLFTLGGLGIWVLIDFIRICFGSFEDGQGRIIRYQGAPVIDVDRSVAEEIGKFAELKEKGIISEEEFVKKKGELL